MEKQKMEHEKKVERLQKRKEKEEKKQRIQNPLRLLELSKIKCNNLQGHRMN
jgi:hypothetical protein